jgi:mannan endo-1,4-beta-mannosidase
MALGLCLTILSYFVWTSPTAPLNPIHILAQEASHTALENHLTAKNAEMAAQVKLLKKQLADSKSSSAKTQHALDKLNGQFAATTKAHNATLAAAAAAAAKPHASSKPVPTPVTAPSLASIESPTSKYFGLYTAQAPFNWATYDDTTAKVGETPNMVGYFGGWDQPFRADAVTAAWKRDTLPVLTWESRPADATNNDIDAPAYSLHNILAGDFDTYLRTYAQAIVANGLPLGIRFDHEMNGIWYPWAETDGQGNPINGNSPGEYVKVWRYVHDIFQAEGANQYVMWIWSPNIINNLPASHQSLAYTESLYPGDAYVDWVGLSGYLRPPYVAANDFSFNYTFGSSLQQLRQMTNKPIVLSELGASDVGGHKPQWIASLFAALKKPENADIVGFGWFNLAVTSYTEGVLATNDWRIESRPDSLAAFITGLTAPGSGFVLKPAPQ